MAGGDPEDTFKVSDRRRRSEDGEPPVVAAPRPEPRADSTPAPRPAQEPHQPAERTLTGLFVMLASSAAMALGDAPDPMTGKVDRDLGQAAALVDVLLLLREKTEGHRTPEETQVLEELLYDLRLRYVAATKRS